MEYLLYFMTFSMFMKITTGIQCYKCSPEKKLNGVPLCAHFNKSDKYLVDCPSSTMCFKRTSALLAGEGFTSTERGCAFQTMDGDQRQINRKWEFVNIIYEPYEEGCKEDHTDEERLAKITNCYCRGDLCNSSHVNVAHFTVLIMFFIILKLSS